MLLHDTLPNFDGLVSARPMTARQMAVAQSGHARLPACPQCGDDVLAPLLAEHVSARHVRNHWVCEGCGFAFLKSVRVASARDD
jgi:predicted RNA-binding Zn-ribbon protein involved in translation (DUF1610 family)